MRRGQSKVGARIHADPLRKKVSVEKSGSMGRINSVKSDNVDAYVDFDELGGRGKAKRDAKAKKKIAKRTAPSRKAVRARTKASKNVARETRASKSDGSKGMKVLDTINKTISTAGAVLGAKTGADIAEPTATEQGAEQPKAAFSFTAWYMILAYIVIVALILYMIFKKK